jgi:uncharacterized YigZ family protein
MDKGIETYYSGVRYLVPAKQTRIEQVVINSRFIADIAPAFSVEEARQFIKKIQMEFPDASHHVPAFQIGHGANIISHCSDAGEPSGTAGRPILTVLSGSGLGDVVLVVTRYFGGTKLGTGGLVRAYSAAAKEVLESVPRAMKIAGRKILVSIPYHYYDSVKNQILRLDGSIIEQVFLNDITITALIPADKLTELQRCLQEISNGVVKIDPMGSIVNILIPEN